MKSKYHAAIELLMCHPDCVVAEMLGIRLSTLRDWMNRPDFAEALRNREREQRASLRRISIQAAINAAASLCQAAGEQSRPDMKALLEMLKLSGAFESESSDPAEALSELIKRAAQEETVDA